MREPGGDRGGGRTGPRLVAGPRGCRLFVDRTDDLPLAWMHVALRGGAAADPGPAPAAAASGGSDSHGDAGSDGPGGDLHGLAHHVATLARRGAGARDRASLDLAVDQLGGSLEAHAGRDAVSLSGLCLSRHVDELAALCADVLAAPHMDADEHHKLVRETVCQLDELRDDDAAVAERHFDRACAPGHPYARSPLGCAASLAAIDRLTPGALRAAHARAAAPENLLFGFAGDIDEARAVALAGAIVDRLPDGPPPPLPDVSAPAPMRGRRLLLVDKPGRTQCQVVIGHPGPRYGTADALALSVVTCAFGGMFTSRLMQEVRVNRGWSYGAGCTLGQSRGAHWFRIQLAPAAEVAADAVALVLEMFDDVARRGITPDELALARSYLAGSLPFHTATARQRMRLAFLDELCGLPADYHATLPARLEAVTLDEANLAARTWLRPDDALVVAVATADALAPGLHAAVGGSLQVAAHDAY